MHRHGIERLVQRLQIGAMRRGGGPAQRQQGGALGRRRARVPHPVAKGRQRGAQALNELFEPVEIAQAGLYLEQHPIRRHRTHGRRERETGMQHALQRTRIAQRVGRRGDELRRQAERGIAPLPGLHAERARARIGVRDDALRLHQRERHPAQLGRQRRGERLERQQGQVQGNPEHGAGARSSLTRCAKRHPMHRCRGSRTCLSLPPDRRRLRRATARPWASALSPPRAPVPCPARQPTAPAATPVAAAPRAAGRGA